MINNESIDTGYCGSIVIPKEIRDMKSTILNIGGIKLDARELGTGALAIILFFVSYKLCSLIIPFEFTIVISLVCATPAILFGFVRINGLAFDDWWWVWFANKKMSTAIRKNNSMNEFEKLENLYDLAHTKKNKKKSVKISGTYKLFH